MTFNPSMLRDAEHREKFKAFLRGYAENGGTALQVNLLDADMLRDAQEHPENYRHLLVRVTGYNAYFTTIGRELQNEIIARESSPDAMTLGQILHLQRLSTEDGPGIRTTVFFKGCPLRLRLVPQPGGDLAAPADPVVRRALSGMPHLREDVPQRLPAR